MHMFEFESEPTVPDQEVATAVTRWQSRAVYIARMNGVYVPATCPLGTCIDR